MDIPKRNVDACFSQDEEPVYYELWMRPIEAYRLGMEQPKHVWQSKYTFLKQ